MTDTIVTNRATTEPATTDSTSTGARSGSSVLSTALLATLNERLIAERKELEGLTEGTPEEDAEPSAHGFGETEHLAAFEQQGVTAVVGEMSRVALDEVIAALDRIEDGTYGICGGCGEPVSEDRLDAMPATRHCLPCQVRSETGAP